jgi:hypothetical protein
MTLWKDPLPPPPLKYYFGKNRYKETHPIYNGNIVSLVVKFMPSKHVSRVRFPNGVPPPLLCFYGLMVKRSSSKGKIMSSILIRSFVSVLFVWWLVGLYLSFSRININKYKRFYRYRYTQIKSYLYPIYI